MILVIAEKPSLGRTIRDAVGDKYRVVALRGHVLEQASPDDYLPADIPKSPKTGRKIWRKEDLPIVPTKWLKYPKGDTKDVLKEVLNLIKSADRIINAGDPDREGQLLVDEVIEHSGFNGPVDRVWLTALTPDAIRKSFDHLESNTKYKPLSLSAEARSRADWLVGMNLTRAWTMASGQLVSIGRVQTPTLGLIVQRDLAIENFKSQKHFGAVIEVNHANGSFMATWKPSSTDGVGFNEDGLLLDRSIADRVASLRGQGTIAEYSQQKKERSAPLPFDLGSLQKSAGAKLGLSAQETLSTAQTLYEQGYTSYPRSECRYLNNEQHAEVSSAVKSIAGAYKASPNPSFQHSAFNTSKVGAHTAIVPTGKSPADLNGRERSLYDLIAKATIALFLPNEGYLGVSTAFEIGGERFTATSKRVTDPGWTSLYGGKDEEEDEEEGSSSAIPEMNKGDSATAADGAVVDKETKPPARFTDGTLIDAMSSIYRYVTDEKARARLKETSGIGTSATRANVIETLLLRQFIERKKGKLISTESGRALIAAVNQELSNPVMTALWEDALEMISTGKLDHGVFEKKIVEFVTKSLGEVKAGSIGGGGSARETAPCPVCSQMATRLESKKTKGHFYWACANKEHGLMKDDNGKPGALFDDTPKAAPAEQSGSEPDCPKCKTAVTTNKTGTGKTYFRCQKCKSAWWPDFENKNKLGKKWDK